jgi:hypothetical protein
MEYLLAWVALSVTMPSHVGVYQVLSVRAGASEPQLIPIPCKHPTPLTPRINMKWVLVRPDSCEILFLRKEKIPTQMLIYIPWQNN